MAVRKSKSGKFVEMTDAEAIVYDNHWDPRYSYERVKRRIFMIGYAAAVKDSKAGRLVDLPYPLK